MNEYSFNPRINYDDEEVLAALEAEVREQYGDEQVESQFATAEREITHVIGTGDLPPGYDPEKDPLAQRRRAVARKVVLITLASAGSVAAISAIVHHHRRKDDPK